MSMGAHILGLKKSWRHIALSTAICAAAFTALPQQTMAQAVGDDLCPEPQAASRQTPNDLASIQSDIERFTLCIRRAELLNQLNTLVQENQDLMGVGFGRARMQAPAPTPSVPNMVDLPDLNTDIDLSDAGLDQAPREDTIDPDLWVIEEIYGVASNLRAKLTNGREEIAVVRQGDILPDGKTVVRVTGTALTLQDDGETLILNWLE